MVLKISSDEWLRASSASPMIVNSRSTADRIRRVVEYSSSVRPSTAVSIASHASITSERYALATRGIQHLLGALDVLGDVSVLHRAFDDQVDFDREDLPQLIKEFEVRVDTGIGIHRLKLDQEINITVTLRREIIT